MEKTQRQTIINFFLILIVSACTPLSIGTPDSTAETYRPSQLILAAVPSRAAPQLYDTWLPFVNYIAAETGLPVKMTTADTYEEHVPMILNRRPDLAYVTGLQYLTLHRDGDYEAVIGVLPLSIGVLLVRADSPTTTLSDLRGKTIGLTSPSDLAPNVQMRAFLADNGLVAGEDYQVEIFEIITLGANAVIAGQVDAGAVSLTYYQLLPDEQQAQFRILAETPPLPPAPFVAPSDLAQEIKEMLIDTLLSMNETSEGQAIMKKLGWDQMIHVDDAAYDAVREFAEEHGIEYK